jgi:predicted RNA-binding Zn-ribbon protein involved in translation (DUF1610 family)
MTTVRRQETFRSCAVCHRTLLLGERAARYVTSPGGENWVDVCSLCVEQANEYGWIKEGTPTQPIVAETPRKQRRGPSLAGLFERSRRPTAEPVVSEPVLRRLSPEEQTLVEIAELFNASPYSRTIAGVAKSLGEGRASMIPLSGTNTEMVITIAWEISWYQYRVALGSSQPVRLEERGQDLGELHDRFKTWNASFDPQHRLRPDIPRF